MNRTKSKKIANIEYCIYCGNKSVHDYETYGTHGREENHFETCNCKGSELALDIDKQIAMLEHKKDSLEINYSTFKDIEYKAEIEAINIRFNK